MNKRAEYRDEVCEVCSLEEFEYFLEMYKMIFEKVRPIIFSRPKSKLPDIASLYEYAIKPIQEANFQLDSLECVFVKTILECPKGFYVKLFEMITQTQGHIN